MSKPKEPREGRSVAAVGRERVPGEPRQVAYDPALHPGLVYRSFRLGLDLEQTAAYIGVSRQVLAQWLETKEEMALARRQADSRDADILQSLESHAIGRPDPDCPGEWIRGNPTLLKFLAEVRLGMQKKPPEEEKDFRTDEEIKRSAMNLMRLLKKNQQALDLGADDVTYWDQDRGLQRGVTSGGPEAEHGSPG